MGLDVSRYAFKLELMRDSIYSSLPFNQRRELHQVIAKTMEKHEPNAFSIIALHWESAMNPER